MVMPADLGLLLLRAAIGLLLAAHGLQKVTHLFGGGGLAAGVEEFRHDGFRGGRATALAAGVTQVGAGSLLALGLFTPAAALGGIGVMTVAATVKAPHGLWVQHDGYEYPLVLVVVLLALAFTGPGRWSLDARLGLDHPPLWLGVAVAVVGVGSALATRAVLHTTPPRPPEEHRP